MKNYEEYIGKKYGKLTITGYCFKKHGTKNRRHAICKCECGNECIVRFDCLLNGKSNSCGCLKKQQDRINLTKHHSHKKSREKIYKVWQNMKKRCQNPKSKSYGRYGGRGIKVCDEWLDANNFLEWAFSHGYEEGLQIDRIDNDGNYCPENCRWTTPKVQARNRRSNIIVEVDGKEMCLLDASKVLGINYHTLSTRYHNGDRGKRLLRPLEIKKDNTEVTL